MSRLFAPMVHDLLFALMAHCAVEPSVSVDLTSKESGRCVRRRCCVVLNGTARMTMSLIAVRSIDVRIYLPVIRSSSLRG
jgi:hypothetical protein